MQVFQANKFIDVIDRLKKAATGSTLSYKHAAAVLLQNDVETIGVNKYVNFGQILESSCHKTIHAEVNAYNMVPKFRLRGSFKIDIFVIRINKTNELRYSRPCNRCIDKLRKNGVVKVYYSMDDGSIVCERVCDMPKQHVCSGDKFDMKCRDVKSK